MYFLSIRLPRGVRMPRCADLARQFRAGPDLEEAGEDPADMRGGFLVDHQLAVLDAVAVGRHPAHPHALLPAGGDLVADALGRHLALELGEADSRMFSVSRPIDVVVLNDCVTETKVTPFRSNTSTSLAKSASERLRRSIL